MEKNFCSKFASYTLRNVFFGDLIFGRCDLSVLFLQCLVYFNFILHIDWELACLAPATVLRE
jgi:hypothetical protein